MKFGRHVELIDINIFASYINYLSLIVLKDKNFQRPILLKFDLKSNFKEP